MDINNIQINKENTHLLISNNQNFIFLFKKGKKYNTYFLNLLNQNIYFLKAQILCDIKCLECDQNLICTKCNKFRDNIPSCSCISGYFEDLHTKKCIKCRIGCKSCINNETCLECIQNG
jgi:hypothetical protein